MLQDRGAFLKEERETLAENARASREFPQQLAEGGCGRLGGKRKADKETREVSRSGKREGERVDETVVVERRCVNR